MGRKWFGRKAQLYQHLRFSLLILTVLTVGLSRALSSEELPNSFSYQGRFMNAAGTSPVADGTYAVKFGIYDPSGNCLLYEEQQNITTTNGFFSTQVGSSKASTKRTANNPNQGTPGLRLSMQDVFSNKHRTVVSTADTPMCAASYAAADGDVRRLKIENVT